MDCRTFLLVAVCLPVAVVGCTTTDTTTSRMAPPPPPVASPAPLPSAAPLQTNNHTAQVKKTDAEKLKAKVNILLAKAEANAKLSNVGAARFSPDGKSDVKMEDMELQKARFRDCARRDYQDVIAMDPKNLQAYRGLTSIYLRDGDNDKALATIKKALELAPRDAALLFDQATCYLCRKDWKQAENSLWNALQVAPATDDREIKKRLGFTLAREGEFGKAVEMLSAVYHGVPGLAQYMVARVMQDQGQEQLCKEYLQVAIRTNPKLEMAKDMLFDMEHPEEIRQIQALEPVPELKTIDLDKY